MQILTLNRAKAIYRDAIDARASDTEGDAWWHAVHLELQQVVQARTASEASVVISWWHHDWTVVGDTAIAAARRIRSSARQIKH